MACYVGANVSVDTLPYRPLPITRETQMQIVLRFRVPNSEAHYAGNLVSGSKLMEYFGDAATELLIRLDGDEGLFRAYEKVDFLAPVNGGDFLEISAKIVHVGSSSRKMEFAAYKVIRPRPDVHASSADALDEPILVAQAIGTCVVPKGFQRRTHPPDLLAKGAANASHSL